MQPRGGSAADGRQRAAVMTAPPARPPARPPAPQWSATPPLAALPTAPGLARGHVKATLAVWHLSEFTDTLELIASELAANAVNASAAAADGTRTMTIRVRLVNDGTALTVEVWDQAPGMPVLRDAGCLAETGRGLSIIDTLTGGAWGCTPSTGQPGKQVWAQVPLRPGPPSRFLALNTRSTPPRSCPGPYEVADA